MFTMVTSTPRFRARAALLAGAFLVAATGPLSAQLRFEPIYHVGEFDSPEEEVFGVHNSVALTPDGQLFIADTGSGEIRQFDARGRFVRRFARKGSGPGELGGTTLMALGPGSDSLYVYDQVQHRVSVFTTEGRLARTSRIPLEKTGLLWMSLHPAGYFLFTGEVAGRPELVHVVDLAGRHVRSFGTLLNSTDLRGVTAAVSVVRSQLNQGPAVALPDGDVLVALAAPYRVARFGLNGQRRWARSDAVIANPVSSSIIATPTEYRVGAYARVTAVHPLDADRVAVLHADFERERRFVDVRSTADGRLLSRAAIPYESHWAHLLPRRDGGGMAILARVEPFPRYTVSRWSLP